MHWVCLAGIETIRDKAGTVLRYSDTFLNNIKTFKHDYPADSFKLIDARDFLGSALPMTAIFDEIAALTQPVDKLIISCHSDPDALYIFSHSRYDVEDQYRTIHKQTDWSSIKFSPSAEIKICGCQTAGAKGVVLPDSIAQNIANNSKITTYGFVWKSSQRSRRDGWYVQKPDRGGFVKCTPKKK